MVHRKQLSSIVAKNAVSTPNQITAAEEYQDHENCPFEEEKKRLLTQNCNLAGPK